PGVVGEIPHQPARSPAARRADRFARSRYRRLGARPSRALPQRTRRNRAARLAQHDRGRTAVRARHHHEARQDRGRRHAPAPARPLRQAYAGGGVPRRRARARRAAAGRAMTPAPAIAYSPRRVAAMVLRYWYLLRSSWARLVELIYWPAVQMLMWGFLQLYIGQNASFFARASGIFIGAVM